MSKDGGSILVVDVGTSGVRAAIVRPDATVEHEHRVPLLPDSPAPGLVEFDAARMADAVLEVARAALEDGGPVAGVGIANQRASSIVWERATGQAGRAGHRLAGPAHRRDLPGPPGRGHPAGAQRVGHQGDGHPRRGRSGTVASRARRALLRDRRQLGGLDALGGRRAGGDALHVTDATNAAVTALVDATIGWDEPLLQKLRIPLPMMPTVVDSSGALGSAAALPGAPPICGIAGDQQASLVGQGCTLPGLAKATFGTGGMLDQCVGPARWARRR